MTRTIGTRELMTFAVGDKYLHGTYHRPVMNAIAPESPGVGIVFPNSGILPRTATGDSAVYWADSFARAGYPAYRFDMEGLGDSDGEPPNRMPEFLAQVDTTGYVNSLSAIVDGVADHGGLPGVVLVAHCAGTVSALYTAAISHRIKGVALLDPYFHSPGLSNHSDAPISIGELPGNANLALINCWNRVASEGTPILVLTAPSFRAKAGQFDYLGYLQSCKGRNNRVEITPIEGTPHSFAEGPGKEAVRGRIEEWLSDYFPLEAYPEEGASGNGLTATASGQPVSEASARSRFGGSSTAGLDRRDE